VSLAAAPVNSPVGVGDGVALTVPLALADGVMLALADVTVEVTTAVVVGAAVLVSVTVTEAVVDSSAELEEEVVSAGSDAASQLALAAERTARAPSAPQASRTAAVAAPWMAALLAVSHWQAWSSRAQSVAELTASLMGF